MTERKGICSTCGWYRRGACQYGVTDRPRGAAAALDPCGWWKRKRTKKPRGDAE